MGMLYELEEEADRNITRQMQQTLQEALDRYRVMCDKCDLAMHRHHRYSRAPVYRCSECGGMSSGMESIGEVERGKRFSKKTRTEAIRLAAMGLQLWD